MPRALITVPAAWLAATAYAGHLVAYVAHGLAVLLPVLSAQPGALLGGAVAVLAVAVVGRLLLDIRVPAPSAVPGRSAAIRHWALRAGVPRHRDPDAAGRCRPRAPGPNPQTA